MFLNNEGPSRRAVLKKGNDLFQGVFGSVWVYFWLSQQWGCYWPFAALRPRCQRSKQFCTRTVLPSMPVLLPEHSPKNDETLPLFTHRTPSLYRSNHDNKINNYIFFLAFPSAGTIFSAFLIGIHNPYRLLKGCHFVTDKAKA